jgi:hypothetical protein
MVERAYVWCAGQNLLVFVGLAFALLSVACEAGFRLGGRRARRQPNREHEREGAALCRKRIPPALRGKGSPEAVSGGDPDLRHNPQAAGLSRLRGGARPDLGSVAGKACAGD